MQMQRPPKNCREAFTAEGDQVYTNRYYTPEQEVMAKYLGGDPEAEIRQVIFFYLCTWGGGGSVVRALIQALVY